MIDLELAKQLYPGCTLYSNTARNSDGSPMRLKVNGQPKTWKRQPGRVSIPYKHGLYDYGYIDETGLAAVSLTEAEAYTEAEITARLAGKGRNKQPVSPSAIAAWQQDAAEEAEAARKHIMETSNRLAESRQRQATPEAKAARQQWQLKTKQAEAEAAARRAASDAAEAARMAEAARQAARTARMFDVHFTTAEAARQAAAEAAAEAAGQAEAAAEAARNAAEADTAKAAAEAARAANLSAYHASNRLYYATRQAEAAGQAARQAEAALCPPTIPDDWSID